MLSHYTKVKYWFSIEVLSESFWHFSSQLISGYILHANKSIPHFIYIVNLSILHFHWNANIHKKMLGILWQKKSKRMSQRLGRSLMRMWLYESILNITMSLDIIVIPIVSNQDFEVYVWFWISSNVYHHHSFSRLNWEKKMLSTVFWNKMLWVLSENQWKKKMLCETLHVAWKLNNVWQKAEANCFDVMKQVNVERIKWVMIAWRHHTEKLSVNTVIRSTNQVNSLRWKSKWISIGFCILHYDNCSSCLMWHSLSVTNSLKLIWFR